MVAIEGEKLRILLIGSGGREHALAWKLSQSPLVDSIKVVPGNGGTATGLPKVQNASNVDPDDFEGLLAFAREHEVNLVVPGPEVPLVAGVGSMFRANGIRCFGPTKKAARLEGSKTFAKDFMARHRIPTAQYENFSDYHKATEHLKKVPYKVVIKATGLAAGKGVVVPSTAEEAQAALKDIMLNKEFGSAGDEVVIEEYVGILKPIIPISYQILSPKSMSRDPLIIELEGQELSFLSFSDGYSILTLPPGQDHKQIRDADIGPNTGGMGCYAPSPVATPELIEEVHRTILQPTIEGMRKERMPFVGMLFTGLMITKQGPRTLEYNVRFGDPETQTMLPLMDGDLADVMVACTEGCLDAVSFKPYIGYAATVVASAGGYPGGYTRGDEITLDAPPADTQIFHAGTKGPTAPKTQHDGQAPALVTSGGRVIAATSTAVDLKGAIDRAYEGMSAIHFANMHYRKDIGKKGLEILNVRAGQEKKTPTSSESLTYASAGVSVASGNASVKQITALAASTKRPGASATLGGFGGVVDLNEAGYEGPKLVFGADGVGTKLIIARSMKKHDTIGIDLVAMCVNDLVVQGAAPFSFLDIFTCNKLMVDDLVKVVAGICAGCREAGCTLVGGETAEHPGQFSDGEAYDVGGFATGAIAQGRPVLPIKEAMKAGDALLGLASSGCHSNGFTLIREIVDRRSGLSYHDKAPWDTEESVGKSLLTPTRIYVQPLLKLYNEDLVKGMAHITGGGLTENVPRMLPEDLAAEMDATSWHFHDVFRWLKEQGQVENEFHFSEGDKLSMELVQEFAKTFNCGLGMVIVVAQEKVEKALEELSRAGETVHVVGRLIERDGKGCVVKNMETWQ